MFSSVSLSDIICFVFELLHCIHCYCFTLVCMFMSHCNCKQWTSSPELKKILVPFLHGEVENFDLIVHPKPRCDQLQNIFARPRSKHISRGGRCQQPKRKHSTQHESHPRRDQLQMLHRNKRRKKIRSNKRKYPGPATPPFRVVSCNTSDFIDF